MKAKKFEETKINITGKYLYQKFHCKTMATHEKEVSKI